MSRGLVLSAPPPCRTEAPIIDASSHGYGTVTSGLTLKRERRDAGPCRRLDECVGDLSSSFGASFGTRIG